MLVSSPEPPWKSAALRLSGAAKIAELTAAHLFGQKSVLFYGSNMIRPPRWAAKTAAVSIRRTAPAGAANADVQKEILRSAVFPSSRPAARKSLPCARGGVTSPQTGDGRVVIYRSLTLSQAEQLMQVTIPQPQAAAPFAQGGLWQLSFYSAPSAHRWQTGRCRQATHRKTQL